MARRTGVLALPVLGLVLGLLAACGRQETPLPGERLLPRALDGDPAAERELGPRPFAAPAVTRNTDWTHRGGNARHFVPNPALGAAPSLAWAVRIGEGAGKRHRISADPVVAGGRIFTMDSRATVAAVSAAGALLWQTDLTPASDDEDDGSGGGLATDGARVFATTSFGRLTALDAETGAVLWTQRLDAAATSPPTVAGDTVYAVSNDSRGWAIDAATGRIRWETAGADSPSGMLGGAGPAVTDRLVLMPFPSAELSGTLRQSGLRIWSAPVTGSRPGRVYARFTDVTGDPVVAGDRIYVGNPSGRTYALDLATGKTVWNADEGALGPVQVAGDSVFLISDQNRLVRLDAETGRRVWAVELPYFEKERLRRRRDITDHYGPVLAGGRLVVASGDGRLRFFDPADGAATGAVSLPGGAASIPAVAGGTLYAVGSDGMLHAFR